MVLATIVLATAKIHILKQFTTPYTWWVCGSTLCLLLQRYTFWSNSQRCRSWYTRPTYCACYCKDTHFEAIHNRGWMVLHRFQLCLLLQRYTFWSNSQRYQDRLSFQLYCACYCKDTHFEAIHNVQSWTFFVSELCLLLQRYTFWSNSQRRHDDNQGQPYCACYCKDTHFEAIHNISPHDLSDSTLCLLLQRYTFWSNSQQWNPPRRTSLYCACYCKDTHFEAIHNHPRTAHSSGRIVLATAKIHILKQFTTICMEHLAILLLCLLLQRYTFWSNSQHPRSYPVRIAHCACYCKDTHFEAIHNTSSKVLFPERIVLATAKIHILKQFTTLTDGRSPTPRLCLLLQRYTFWSNSQQIQQPTEPSSIVLATAKIHILKQFTTDATWKTSELPLCLLLQRYTFWSNSQRIFWWFFQL